MKFKSQQFGATFGACCNWGALHLFFELERSNVEATQVSVSFLCVSRLATPVICMKNLTVPEQVLWIAEKGPYDVTMKTSYKNCWQRGLHREVPVGFDAFQNFASFRTAQVNAVALSTALAACEVAGRWEIALQLIAERAEILVTWEQQDLWSLYWPLSHFNTLRRWPSDVFDGLQLWMNLSMPGTVST